MVQAERNRSIDGTPITKMKVELRVMHIVIETAA
jgi:hypothetical protein